MLGYGKKRSLKKTASLYFLLHTQKAWIMPGSQKKKQSIRLMIKSLPNPFSKKTAKGGKRIQSTIVKIDIIYILYNSLKNTHYFNDNSTY